MQKISLLALLIFLFLMACKGERQDTNTSVAVTETAEMPAPEPEAEAMPDALVSEIAEMKTMEMDGEPAELEEIRAAEKEPSNLEKAIPPTAEAQTAAANTLTESKESASSRTTPESPGGTKQPDPQTIDLQSVKESKESTPVKKKPAPPSHETWNQLLSKYVSSTGKVNYSGIKNDIAKLDAYLSILKKNPPQDDWSRSEKMAFWINAYNAFTVKLIVDNYPVSSITSLHGGKPWDVKWIKIGGKTYSLNNIENDILRPKYKDARIHFAVNCAAKSCPPLLNRAWTANNLELNFEQQAKAFVNNSDFNSISTKKVQVSKIFEWYAADFGNLIEYLNRYSETEIKPNAKVEFKEYDWALNSR